MHDAHTHIQNEATLNYLKEHHLPCIVNASSIEEFEFLNQHRFDGMYISCGVHPWHVQKTDYNALLPYINQADFLGEIGLDKPWCDTPFELQKEVFLKQLALDMKVAILHTKGYEKEVLECIRLFPRKYLVHWYSSLDYIDEYKALDCFFTIGSSVLNDEVVREVARKVPLNRLLIETDGLDALMWALNRQVDLEEYKNILEEMIKEIAKIKNVAIYQVKQNLIDNFNALTCNL